MSRPQPAVSVLLTTYRPREEWIRAAIESVLAQTRDDFELLVLDDEHASTTREIAESYEDPRVIYSAGPQRGPAANHAFGIEAARAPLLSVINHDDTWEPRLVDALVAAYDATESAVMAFGDLWVIDDQGDIDPAETESCSVEWGRTGLKAGRYQPFDNLGLCSGAISLAQAAVFRRDAVVGKLPDHVDRAYDRYLIYLLARTGLGAVYVRERLASWRTSSTNLTNQRSLRASVGSLRMWWTVCRDPGVPEAHRCARRSLVESTRSVVTAALQPRTWG